MPKHTTGGKLDTIFSRTDLPATAPAKPRKRGEPAQPDIQPATTETAPAPRVPGRPRKHTDPMQRVPLEIPITQITYLDTLATTIRARSSSIIKRADIIRAILDAVETSSLDLSTATTKEEIYEMIARKLK